MIPIVVGPGDFNWMMSVVGLLIAGEIYIHFKDKSIQESKLEELCIALHADIPHCKIPESQTKELRTDNPDIFFSNESKFENHFSSM